MRVIQELGEQLERTWSAAGHDPAAFAPIAAEALAAARLHERVAVDDVLAWLAGDPALPPQNLPSRFGEPPLTVYSTGRWAIDLLFWVEGRTTVHAHDFAGAFTVLAGSSIQRRYAFTPRGPDRGPLALGALRLTDITLLGRGAVEPIAAGDALIHSVFHLDRPTVSVVARTDGGLARAPQYDYWAPGVAVDPEHVTPLALRQQQTLTMLLRAGHPSAPAFAARLVAGADLHATFRLLDLVLDSARGDELLPALLATARERHGNDADALLAALRQARWEHAVGERRRGFADPDLRFLLGALVTAPCVGDVRSLVAARWPGRDPDAVLRALVGLLVGAGTTRGTDAHFADACVLVAARLMEDRTMEAVVAELAASGPGSVIAPLVGDLGEFCANLREGMLRPLFVRGRDQPLGS
jgi:hypothetical protein